MKTHPFIRNPWPYAILGTFAVFVTWIGMFIIWAARQDMDLVQPDYYDQEIRFQEQWERQSRTQLIRDQVSLAYDPVVQEVAVALPAAHAQEHPSGRIQFYRPSDADLDVERPLQLGPDGKQRLSVRDLAPGLWKVRLSWTVRGEEYFADQPIMVGMATKAAATR